MKMQNIIEEQDEERSELSLYCDMQYVYSKINLKRQFQKRSEHDTTYTVEADSNILSFNTNDMVLLLSLFSPHIVVFDRTTKRVTSIIDDNVHNFHIYNGS
jgi:hypothetical protein